jgi:hypothetical protein
MSEVSQPEMVGATENPFALAETATGTRLKLVEPSGPARNLAPGQVRHAYLNVEKVTGRGVTAGYEIYLNLPEGADPENHPHLFAGLLPLFGVEKASSAGRGHLGSGLHYVIEITELLDALQAQPDWHPDELRITFVPRRLTAEPYEVRIGRVSLYLTCGE